jgi:hypothetical protein
MRIFTFFIISLFLAPIVVSAQAQIASASAQLKSVIYDFDGLDIGATNLPDGDYSNTDLFYSVSASPLPYSEVIGDRVLKLDMNWQAGFGEFGKATMRFIELNAGSDFINFYFYNPPASSGNLPVQVVIAEDDNQDNFFDAATDDKWTATVNIPQSPEWQLFSIPLSSFTDANTGGDATFNAAYTNAAGMVLSVGFILNKPNPSSTYDQFYVDMICFSEGALPHGPGILDLPAKDENASCFLGALGTSGSPDQVPGEIQGLLPGNKKLSFINWFVYYSKSGTTANEIPGPEVQNLINAGYTPVITWEMMFAGYSRLDPVQPRLDKLLNGSFDGYIDAFAKKIKTYSGNVILRIFHEFEGDWYCWSLTQNNADAGKYIAAYRHVVDRFRNLGVYNVQWMWCVNAEPKPYTAYNWIMSCYPGDNYVDIVATDIYNHPNYGTPPWKSFRYTIAESYYYLSKYVPGKPLYICEVASRERNAGEASGSQTKSEWICQMNRDLQAYFNRTKAVIFFSIVKEHDWRINSSSPALQAFVDCIWNDPFYNGAVDITEFNSVEKMRIYPNPFKNEIKFIYSVMSDTMRNVDISLVDVTGKVIVRSHLDQLSEGLKLGTPLPPGMYTLEMRNNLFTRKYKMVKSAGD